jgi:hypothetical protein
LNPVSGRLADMAAIEQVASIEVEPGQGQRLQRVLGLLSSHDPGIAEIHLLDSLHDFPRSGSACCTRCRRS